LSNPLGRRRLRSETLISILNLEVITVSSGFENRSLLNTGSCDLSLSSSSVIESSDESIIVIVFVGGLGFSVLIGFTGTGSSSSEDMTNSSAGISSTAGISSYAGISSSVDS